MAILVTGVDGLSTVTGIHGGSGETKWKALGGPSMMEGDWDAIEYAVLSGGASAGVHTHTMTEEVWFVLSGRNRMTLGDTQIEVGPGDLILTGLGGSHGSQQLGDEPYVMLVIATRRNAPRVRNGGPDQQTGQYHRVNLDHEGERESSSLEVRGPARVGSVSPATLDAVLGSAWRTMATVSLPAGASLSPRSLSTSEVFVFVRSGTGVARDGHLAVSLQANVALSFTQGSTLHLEQTGEQPLDVVLMELGVPGRST